MADVRSTSNLTPQLPTAQPRVQAARAAQAAFFQTALVEAGAQPVAAARSTTPVRAAAAPVAAARVPTAASLGAEPPVRMLRPGSLLDIKV